MIAPAPTFPPLLSGLAVGAGLDPFAKAMSMAMIGCDSGLVTYAEAEGRLCWALVLAPEGPLEEAMAMVLAAGVAFSDALGALGPPETAVHLEWPGTIRLNGAQVGAIRAGIADADMDPAREVPWLCLGLDVALKMEAGREPGYDPDRTTLAEEGCGDIGATQLLESWSRHMLVWINR
ncbi:MAG: biotin/lipoate--protein ligase family protein, partial [Pseudomonadota bacterium]